MVKIKNWSVQVDASNPYQAPETKAPRLVGEVYGYPGRPDGHRVSTSRILSAKGREVTTKSRTYLLVGPPDPGWIRYLLDNGLPLPDVNNPISVRIT